VVLQKFVCGNSNYSALHSRPITAILRELRVEMKIEKIVRMNQETVNG
jgi:hypothetical protein